MGLKSPSDYQKNYLSRASILVGAEHIRKKKMTFSYIVALTGVFFLHVISLKIRISCLQFHIKGKSIYKQLHHIGGYDEMIQKS